MNIIVIQTYWTIILAEGVVTDSYTHHPPPTSFLPPTIHYFQRILLRHGWHVAQSGEF